MSDVIVNKVAGSGLITLDLEKYLPSGEAASFDLKDHLFMGLILKEKDFREALKSLDWSVYSGKNVAVFCSVDAIIPVWAYMLVASYLQPVAKYVYVGTEAEMQKHLFLRNLEAINPEEFRDQRIVVKGCGEIPIDSYAYAEITRLLTSVAKSVMYGEPCSTVPIFKKK
ncbi:MAG TPA: DUF2480 family protein [Flavisolibacter sp.]|jgi:hypothetical protein